MGLSLILRPPSSDHSYSIRWILIFWSEVFVIEPSIGLEIMSEKTLLYKICTSCELMAKFCRSLTTKDFGRGMFKLPMSISPKYLCYWTCISEMCIWYTWQKIFLLIAPVFTMNASPPQRYLLDILRKWFRIYLAFETEISNLSPSFHISFFAWR